MADASPPPAGRGRIFAWTLFDFANTAFSVIIVTVVFSRYFTAHVAGGRQWLWGLAVSISMVCSALLSPPLGAAADYSHNRKRFLLLFTLVCVAATGALFFVQEGMVLAGIILFVVANVGFEGGLVFYDAFLPGITSRSSYGRVSGYGFAMGYLGALAVLLIVYVVLPDQAHPEYLWWVRFSFVIAAAFFLAFSLPLFAFVPEVHNHPRLSTSYLREGIRRSAATFRSLFVRRENPTVARFLLAFFLYNDGIVTVIMFAGIFAGSILKMSDRDIIMFFAIVQTSAIIGSLVFGVVTDKIGPKRTITFTLVLWIAICAAAYTVASVAAFYAVALTAGVAIGSSQSASRSLMALLTPREREAEYFGFYDGLCGKASAIVGPLIYGYIADVTGARVAVLVIGLFFVAGLLLLQGVEAPAHGASARRS